MERDYEVAVITETTTIYSVRASSPSEARLLVTAGDLDSTDKVKLVSEEDETHTVYTLDVTDVED